MQQQEPRRDAEGMEAGTAEWHEARRFGIGGSEIAVVMGHSPFSTKHRLFAQKLGLEPETATSEAMRMGTLLEPTVAGIFQTETGRQVERHGRLLRHPEHRWAFATPDYKQRVVGRPEGLLEIKTTSFGRAWEDEVPPNVLDQVQWQLFVSGHTWASVAVLISGQRFRWADVERDENHIEDLFAAGEAFMRLIETSTPPDLDGSDDAAALLARLYPAEAERLHRVALSGEMLHWDEQRENAVRAIREAEALRTEAENHIKRAIGFAEEGALPSGAVYTWKVEQRAGHVVAPSEPRVLRRKEPRV